MLRLMACLFLFSAPLFARQDVSDTLRAEEPLSFRQSDLGIIAAVGLSTGGGFGDLVNAELRDQGYVTTGRMIFVTAELGMEFRVRDRFFFTPRVNWLHTMLNRREPYMIPMSEYNSATDPYEIAMDDITIFSMLTFSAGGRYYLHETLPYLFYLEGGLGFMSAASRVSKLAFSPDGPVTALLAGYSFSWGRKAIGLEFGYRWIPVSHPRSSFQRINGHMALTAAKDTRDFGGMFLNLVWRLDFF